ncbi:hypothetical protein ANCCEY_02303 [Ancylostoma ceylanicum]|uniref:Peptidase M13 N-terminal domain-containing protein n=1 Tax=Ancylostoma ceylanicum TaxID=53326 RepID=A0A0D6M4Z6_9BILA|nr:hypothetical protein ANCCEY_02303 [Ancylostoma ceylanicum]
MAVQFDQGDLGLGEFTRDYYLDRERHGEKIAAYRKFLIDKVTQFLHDADLPTNSTKIASDVDEIIDLETKWAEIIVPEENRRDYSRMYNLRRLNDMQEVMPLVLFFYSYTQVQRVDHYLGYSTTYLLGGLDSLFQLCRSLRCPRLLCLESRNSYT